MNPLKEIMDVLRDFPEVISVIDTVSPFSVIPIPKDEWGIGRHTHRFSKGFGHVPGLALLSVSERAFKRAEEVEGRGYYFDFRISQESRKRDDADTPVIPLIHALDHTLKKIFNEGVENRHARHAEPTRWFTTGSLTKALSFFPKNNMPPNPDLRQKQPRYRPCWFRQHLREQRKISIDGGYGKMKGKTFRISNMGDETVIAFLIY